MLELKKWKIAKVVKKHVVRFTTKYRVFSILQKNIEDVVNKSTQIWKLVYGLTTAKQGEVDPLEGKDDDKYDDKDDDKYDDKEDDDEDNTVGGETEKQDDDTATAKLE